ncbi:hypothetical protein [Streptomyces sp. SID11385]|uniref:hypothetical protein n=1 Tax=Streptomyces sp. SID11385 TaxID=2706031 RepID=UPI0013CAF145|nr:hypothetical protein [Streptomyces sp. SID11385]NEA41446.1 hypothetical protein [Streptomyces sp. SID11385]
MSDNLKNLAAQGDAARALAEFTRRNIASAEQADRDAEKARAEIARIQAERATRNS